MKVIKDNIWNKFKKIEIISSNKYSSYYKVKNINTDNYFWVKEINKQKFKKFYDYDILINETNIKFLENEVNLKIILFKWRIFILNYGIKNM